MKLISKSLAAAGLAASAFAATATPAAAQVNGIATSSPEAVIVRAAARQAAYNTIAQTYAAQIQQVTTLRQTLQTQGQTLDADKDGNVTEAEFNANPTLVQQIQQTEQQIQQLSQPIALAQAYAIEQLINDYNNARTEVINAKGIQIMLAPDALQYAPEGVNVTSDIVAALDRRMPTVQTTPPAGWQPRRESLQMQQTVQQVLIAAVQQQQAAAAAQQQAQQPTGR